MKTLRLTMVLAVLAAAFATAEQAAAANWGTNYLTDPGCCTLQGLRSQIDSPGYYWIIPTEVIATMSVFAQSGSASTSAGLMQIGLGQSGAGGDFSTCGPIPNLETYWEYLPYTSDPTNGYLYICGTVGAPIGNSVVSHRYSVSHDYNPYGSPTYWEAFYDGVSQVQADVGFTTATLVHAGGEFNTLDPTAHPYGLSGACFGCSSGTPFQRATHAFGDPAGSGWTTIQSTLHRSGDDNGNADPNWYVGFPPSPFTILHTNTSY
jgi:hypothetical protein